MATRLMNPLSGLVQRVRRAALLREPAQLPDGRLLQEFIDSRNEAAFEMLLKRHGPMVLGVCRRILGNHHDAEDAFQAVFLVLARKAHSVTPRDLVGNWLHGVAFRTALQARGRLGRKRAREKQVTDMPQIFADSPADAQELHQALDRELGRLPMKYRSAIVLCDLEGRSRKEVAGQLKIPEGTLSSRLAKGRELLARRLARHGLVLTSGMLASTLIEQTALGALTPSLVSVTVQAAALAAAGQSAAGLVSTNVLALSQGVMKAMFLDKLKVLALLIACILGGFGAGVVGVGPSPTAQAAAPSDPGQFVQAKTPQPDDPEPLDGQLLLDAKIQKELRLSKNQIDRLKAVSQQVDQNSGEKKQEIKGIQKENSAKQKEIEQLQRQIAELQQKIHDIEQGIERERVKSVGKAAGEILSSHATQRLREIQRQRRGLEGLLQDAKVQRMLNVNDEQVKKFETILRERPSPYIRFETVLTASTVGQVSPWGINLQSTTTRPNLLTLRQPAHFYGIGNSTNALAFENPFTFLSHYQHADDQTDRKLFDVLTDAQQRQLLDWVGEPYESAGWQQLREKRK